MYICFRNPHLRTWSSILQRKEWGRERERWMGERNASWLPLTHAWTGTQIQKPVEGNEAPTGAEEFFLSNEFYLYFLQNILRCQQINPGKVYLSIPKHPVGSRNAGKTVRWCHHMRSVQCLIWQASQPAVVLLLHVLISTLDLAHCTGLPSCFTHECQVSIQGSLSCDSISIPSAR